MVGDAFKALGDPTRRRILELRSAGLVTSRHSGQSIIYHLNTTVFQELMQWIAGLGHASGKDGGHGRS